MANALGVCNRCETMGAGSVCWLCGRKWSRVGFAETRAPHRCNPLAVEAQWFGVTVPIEGDADQIVD